MSEFVYKARKKNGTTIQGVLEAADRMAALAQLQKQGLLPVSVEATSEKDKKAARRSRTGAKNSSGLLNLLPQGLRDYLTRQRKPSLKELANYSIALSSITGGRASFTTSFSSYELVPNDIQQELIKQHEAELAEED